MIITLCGSTRFKSVFLEVAKRLTLAGHIILMPAVFHHSDEMELTMEQKIQLDNLHKQKINMSDAIYVINLNGYIGESTYGEIDWANRMGKAIYFLEEQPKPQAATPVEDMQEELRENNTEEPKEKTD